MKCPDFYCARNAPRTRKNFRFLKNVILLPKRSVIEPTNHELYKALRRPPKNRCFQQPGLKNRHFHHISPLSEIKNSVHLFKKRKVHMPPPPKNHFKNSQTIRHNFCKNYFFAHKKMTGMRRYCDLQKYSGVSLK